MLRVHEMADLIRIVDAGAEPAEHDTSRSPLRVDRTLFPAVPQTQRRAKSLRELIRRLSKCGVRWLVDVPSRRKGEVIRGRANSKAVSSVEPVIQVIKSYNAIESFCVHKELQLFAELMGLTGLNIVVVRII